MRILISGNSLNQCHAFEKYLRKYIDKELEIVIQKNFYFKDIKDPNKLNLYNQNLFLMYSTICSNYFTGFLHNLRYRTHRLNIIKYIFITFNLKFFKNYPKFYLYVYKSLWEILIFRYVLIDKFKSLFYKSKKECLLHFHLGCLTTNIEIETCILSKIQRNRIIYVPYNWDNINSKSFIPYDLYESVMSWDPLITNNFPLYLIGKTSINFTSSFRLNYLLEIDLEKKNNKIVFFGTQKDIYHELEQIIKIKKFLKNTFRNYEFIYRPHPYQIDSALDFYSKKDASFLRNPLKMNLDSKFKKIVSNKNRNVIYDFTPLEEILKTSKVAISPGSTTLMEATIYGCVSILLTTNPIQNTLAFMHLSDQFQSLLTLPETYICPSTLVLEKKLEEILLNREISHNEIRDKAIEFFKPSKFKTTLENIVNS